MMKGKPDGHKKAQKAQNHLSLVRFVPEQCAVGRSYANRAGSVEQRNLRDSVDRHPMWRAVAPAAGRAEPAPITPGDGR